MKDAGLTLLEVLVTLTIGSVLIGIAAFGFDTLDRQWRLESAVRQVVLDLRTARSRSISESRPHRIRFTAAGSSYEAEVQGDDGEYLPVGRPRLLPAGVTILDCSGRGDAIGFRPRGNASPFGTVSLHGSDGESRRIVVDMAGRAEVRR